MGGVVLLGTGLSRRVVNKGWVSLRGLGVFVVAAAPPTGASGEVGGCQAHQVLRCLGSGEAAAQAQVQAPFGAEKLMIGISAVGR